jgi:hypothetical protein
VNRPGVEDGQREHCADHGQLDHRAEGLILVDARLLGEAVKNLVSLVPVQGARGIKLVLENQLVGDNVRANEMRDKIPSVVGNQGSKLFFHGILLV